MTILNPVALSLLILMPLLLAFLIQRGRARQNALARVGDPNLVTALVSRVSYPRRRWKAFLWLLTLAALIVALAQPAWGFETDSVQREGIQVMLAVDVSQSMAVQDVVPSRLARARFDLQDFIDQFEGGDVGIVVFAGDAFVYAPLTFNHDSVRNFMSTITTDVISNQGTNLGAALEVALNAFDLRAGARPVILVASDGEDHEATYVDQLARVREMGAVVYTLGYGTLEGSVVPVYDENDNLIDYKRDANDNLVESRLNESVLRALAAETGGLYRQADAGGVAINTLVQAVEQQQSAALNETLVARQVPRFHLFLALALLALTFEMLLSETRRGDVETG